MIKSPSNSVASTVAPNATSSSSSKNGSMTATNHTPSHSSFVSGLVFAGFVCVAVVFWWHVWITGDPASTITCHCGDPSQEIWFLAWTPWAIVHGHSPFLTNALYSGQGGANMLISTSFMVPAAALAPFTWMFGPIASFNVAATLAPALTGWCFFLAARTITNFVPAQVLGGLMFGFSPFVMTNDPFGHLNFTLLFFPPIAFILLFDLCVTRRRPPWLIGTFLAALVITQFFVGTEVLAISILAFGFALLVAIALAPRAAWAIRRRIGVAFGIASGISFAALAYPLWFVLDGPRTIAGYVFPHPATEGASPSALFSAGIQVHKSSYITFAAGYAGAVGPNEGPSRVPTLIYLGIPLVIFLVASVAVWFRRRLPWVILTTTLAAWVLSFGIDFDHVGSSSGPWWLPWRLFAKLPLLGNIFPIRLGFVVTFGAALLLVISLDRWKDVATTFVRRQQFDDRWKLSTRSVQRLIATLVAAIGVGVLVPVVVTNTIPFAVRSGTNVPAWYTKEAQRLPAGTVVLVVPSFSETPMGEQALVGLHYNLANGESVVPTSNGRSEFVVPFKGAQGILDSLAISLDHKRLPNSDVKVVRSAILHWHVGVTVITETGPRPGGTAIDFLWDVYGRPPMSEYGMWVWSGAPK
jgi:hypothetical protein